MKVRALLLLSALLLWADSSKAAARTVVVLKGDTLASIARRELADESAAGEIAALNGLSAGQEPRKKQKLVLPGPERARALAALRGAKASVDASKEPDRKPAAALLAKAWSALRGARYTEAESLAGAAIRRLHGETARFSIVVDPSSGESRFVVQEGNLDVRAGGKETSARSGQVVQTRKSGAPRVTSGAPPPPALVEPADNGRIETEGAQLRWAASQGARSYQVVVSRDLDFRDRIASLQTEGTFLVLPPGVPKGVYYWRVSAVSPGGAESAAAGPRTFQVAREPKGSATDWEWGPIWDPWGVKHAE